MTDKSYTGERRVAKLEKVKARRMAQRRAAGAKQYKPYKRRDSLAGLIDNDYHRMHMRLWRAENRCK